jgi:Phosphatidylglycerophosphatase A.
MNRPGFKQLLQSPALMLGFGFGSGLAKKGPGTAGTLLGLLLFLPLIAMERTGGLDGVYSRDFGRHLDL